MEKPDGSVHADGGDPVVHGSVKLLKPLMCFEAKINSMRPRASCNARKFVLPRAAPEKLVVEGIRMTPARPITITKIISSIRVKPRCVMIDAPRR